MTVVPGAVQRDRWHIGLLAREAARNVFGPGALEPHLTGVGAVFLVWPTLDDLDAAREAVGVIARHARRLVFLSSAAVRDGAAEQGDVIGRAHAEIERAIERSGMAWTFVRPHAFAANVLHWAPAIRSGEPVRVPFAEIPDVPIDERDIATVVVRALTEDGHAGARYEVTGPERLTPVQQLRIIGEAVGREPRWEETPPDEWERQMRDLAMSDEDVAGLRQAYEDLRSAPAPVTDTVRRLTGRPARTFREWVGDHAGDLMGPLPRVRRGDSGLVLVSTWTLPDAERQRAAADAAMDAWRDAPWPAGMLSHSVLLGTDGRTVLHYPQWTGDDAFASFQRTDPPTRVESIDEAVPGIVRNGVTRYRLHRSAVFPRPVTPGVIALESFRVDSGDAGRKLVDSLLARHPAITGDGEPPSGAGAEHFHIAVDGGQVINYAEFADEAAYQRVVDARPRARAHAETTPESARYVPYRTAVAR
ncbi:NmrA family NAD(P)-binding protein [Streptomyces sp. 8K308]|uniref:NmrA family NAD(P)-binding protein n=1 Tax=Streptomyces sp. 8K308 TaxID=2530388 RepID=UPI001404DFCA|nr:NmrA family NAD(P)-binding protein [Streptomyces sp. 8K308]